ncbi:MAG: hypothetical protein IT378_04410 [Sandaracinaceae bacterium]|nr:hypothetical protein [Sandaracinaceae bacterium]
MIVACGCVRQGQRCAVADRRLAVAAGLDVAEVPSDERVAARRGSAGTRLFADASGEPLLAAPGMLIDVRGRRVLPLRLAGVGSAVGLDDGQWLAATDGAIHLMRGPARVSSLRVASPGVPVRVAPAGAIVSYVAAGSTLALIDPTGRLRPLGRFRSPITAVAGTGDLGFVALESGTVWMLRVGARPRAVHRHHGPIGAMALDPAGYLVFSDESTIFTLLGGRPVPLVAGLPRAQLAASLDGVYAYSAPQRRLLSLRNLVAVEAAVAR